MKRTLRSHLTLTAAIFLTLRSIGLATIGVTTAGYTNDFSTAPPAGDWITSSSNIAGSETTFSSAADIDTFVITNNYNAAGLTTAVGSSASDPPTPHELARHNTTLQAVQMRPRATAPVKAANVLVARLRNDTGALIPSINVSYTFANPGLGIEQVPGWQAYYSVTGNSNWIKIPAFSTATPGNLTANLNFGGTGWSSGALAYILWVDDNALLLDLEEASFTMDDFSISVPVTPTISALVSNVTRGVGADPKNPSDDTVSFDVTVSGSNLPSGTPGWTTTGAFPSPPVSGAYNTTFSITNFPLSSLPVTGGLADQSNPSIIGDYTVNAASLPKYAALNLIGGASFVTFDPASAPQWVTNGADMSATLNNGGATAVSVSTTPITFAAGTMKCVTLSVEVQETSVTSNLETPDTLDVQLMTDAGNQRLVGVQDKDNNGVINGYSGTVTEPYDLFPLRDEFNRDAVLMAASYSHTIRLHGLIPAAATTAHILVTGANDSGTGTENFRVRDIVFSTCVDTDNDGKLDSEELVEGTDPNSAASRFRLISQEISGGNLSLTVSTVTGRTYQLDTSTDLQIWTPQAAATAGTGSNLTLTTPADSTRRFARVTVQ